MPISTPDQITVPFATSGLKNAIPAASDPVTGNAGYDAGFPATNMTPKEAGGIPPFGQDFNGILFDITTAIQYLEAGMLFPYSAPFATAVGGYPLGAIVSRTDGAGLWRNTVANNTTNPETFGAGWQPEGAGEGAVVMTNANVTLTALQAASGIIAITGTLTGNLQLIFPTYKKTWFVRNATTGAFSITAKTAAGSGISVTQGATTPICGDGTNIVAISAGQPDATETVKGIVKIATQALVNAGANDTDAITSLKLAQNKAYETVVSTWTNISLGGQIIVSHPWGVLPQLATIEMKCLVANNGYTVGQEFPVTMHGSGDGGTSSTSSPTGVYWDTTQVTARMGLATPILLVNPTSGVQFTPTAANFQMRLRVRK